MWSSGLTVYVYFPFIDPFIIFVIIFDFDSTISKSILNQIFRNNFV